MIKIVYYNNFYLKSKINKINKVINNIDVNKRNPYETFLRLENRRNIKKDSREEKVLMIIQKIE